MDVLPVIVSEMVRFAEARFCIDIRLLFVPSPASCARTRLVYTMGAFSKM